MQGTVITGVGGLVGYKLARVLLDKDISVVGIDKIKNSFTYELEKFPGFKFKIADVKCIEQLRQAIPEYIETIYHLAGQPAVWYANSHPEDDFMVNSLGTVNVLEILRERGKGKIIYTSTGDIYGNTNPTNEEAFPQPTNFYGLSKLTAENYIRLYSNLFPIKFCILRFALIYGPLQKRNIIFDVLKSVNTGTISLFTNLNSEYDFVYIDDSIGALCIAASPQWENKTINISNNIGIQVKDIVESIFKLIPHDPNVEIKVIENNITKKVFPNAKALQLGWQPRYAFDLGIKEVCQWWSSNNAK